MHVDRRQHSDFTQYNIWVGPGLPKPTHRRGFPDPDRVRPLQRRVAPSSDYATAGMTYTSAGWTLLSSAARCRLLLRHSTPSISSTPCTPLELPVGILSVCRTRKGLIILFLLDLSLLTATIYMDNYGVCSPRRRSRLLEDETEGGDAIHATRGDRAATPPLTHRTNVAES